MNKKDTQKKDNTAENWIERLDKTITGTVNSHEYNRKKIKRGNKNTNWKQIYAIAHKINNQKAKKRQEQRRDVATQTEEYDKDNQ